MDHNLDKVRKDEAMEMTDWQTCSAVERIPGKVSGVWVFAGTRIPLSALYENLARGAMIEEFVEWFPGVDEQQVCAVLEHEARGPACGGGALKLLSDQGSPERLRDNLHDRTVDTLPEKGWPAEDNRESLHLAERDGFGVVVTTDQDLRRQSTQQV